MTTTKKEPSRDRDDAPGALSDRIVIGTGTWEFLQAMTAAGEFPTTGDLMDFLEKPWKWAPEYEAWFRLGRPNEEDVNWAGFLGVLALRGTE